MDQLHLLWEYQKADVEVDKLEASIRRSPVRQKLVKYKELFTEQQNAMKHIENEVATMQDRLEALKDAIRMTNEQVHALHAKMESEAPKSAEEVQQFMNDAKRFQNNLTAYEQEVKRIRKDAADRERQQHDVRVRAAKAKSEFDKLKLVFDDEKRSKDGELKALKAIADEKKQPIDSELLDRYREIKRHSVPPLAALNGDQCQGCNMSLPSSISRKVRAGELVECETCGRLLVIL
ncbi:MAG: hypothetical protein IKH30_19730 [Clostridia bacterium]|nr:hypothetical protein [Clostridia bacterium]